MLWLVLGSLFALAIDEPAVLITGSVKSPPGQDQPQFRPAAPGVSCEVSSLAYNI